MEVHRSLESLPVFKKPVITFGSFDGIHKGHKVILNEVVQKAKSRNAQSIVITFHPHPREVIYPKDKSLQLISSIEEKIKALEAIGADHFVIIPFKIEFSQISPQEYIEKVVIEKFNPQLILIGYDHRFGLNRGGGYEMLRQYGKKTDFEVEVIPAQSINNMNISSTKIRNALLDGNIPLANDLLGYHFSFQGKVIRGDQIGRTIGFPTANIKIDYPKKIIPQDGIYAVEVEVHGIEHQAMLYIGTRSTVSKDLERRIEVNIFDFNQDIYDEDILVTFHKKIREDQEFDNLAKLKDAIAVDQESVQSYFRNQPKLAQKVSASIAILNYNGQEMLEAYLPKVLYSSKNEIEIYVIDNASTDDSVEYLKEWHPEVKIIQLDKNYGFAGGYNEGIKQIETEYIALINSDILVIEYWLDPIVNLLDNDASIAVVQPKILSLEARDTFEYAGAGGGMVDKLGYPFCRGRIFDTIEKDSGQYNDQIEVFWTSGAAMVIRTDLFKKFGGFDSDFFAHHEEIDLCWRLKNAGHKLMYKGDVAVYHLGGGTLDYNSPRKAYLNYRNNIRSIIKNEPKLWSVLVQRLCLDLGSSFLFLLQGKLGLFLAIWKAYLGNIGAFNFYRIKRKRNVELRNRFKVGSPNQSGFYNIILPFKYFLFGKNKFSELSE